MQEIKLPPEGKKLADMGTEELSNVIQMAMEIESEFGEKMDPIHMECEDVSVSEVCKVRRLTAILQLKLCLMYGVSIGAEHTRFMFELPEELLDPDEDSRDGFFLWDYALDFMTDIHSFANFSGIGGFSCEYVDIDEISDFAELCLQDGLTDENGVLLDTGSDDADLVPRLAEAMKAYYEYPDNILEMFVEAFLYHARDDSIRIGEFIVSSSPVIPKVTSVVKDQKVLEQSAEYVLYEKCLKELERCSYYSYQITPPAEEFNGRWFSANLTEMEYLETGEFEQGLGLSLSNRIMAAVASVLAERILAQAKVEPKKGRNSRKARNI